MYVYVCIYVCLCLRMYQCSVCVYKFVSACAFTYWVSAHVCMYVCVYMRECVCLRIMCVSVSVLAYVYLYAFI